MTPRSSASHVHGATSTKQLSKSTWRDFDRLFESHNGVWGGCWCMFYHSTGRLDPKSYEENRRAKRSLVRQGSAHGTIVYCGVEPVGWCQFGPREELPRIDRKKGYAPTSEKAWRLTCLFIDRGHRRMGLGGVAVGESIRAMRRLGVDEVEAYPVEGKLSASLLWSGTPELFEEQGFERIRPLGKTSWVYSLRLR